MPITVAAHHLERYENRDDHYEQIFRSMIQPAVELAGLQVSAPKREGTENIQAGIINDLQSADLVLADLSGLNPNVFLELGIRSALDKPVPRVGRCRPAAIRHRDVEHPQVQPQTNI
jgi:nucleoside 2-deoxyribosyltransferase